MDNAKIEFEDPKCTTDFCNSRGTCQIIDIDMICLCEIGYLGNRCQVDKVSYGDLETAYSTTFTALLSNITEEMSIDHIKGMQNLFRGYSRVGLNVIFEDTFSSFLTLVAF